MVNDDEIREQKEAIICGFHAKNSQINYLKLKHTTIYQNILLLILS